MRVFRLNFAWVVHRIYVFLRTFRVGGSQNLRVLREYRVGGTQNLHVFLREYRVGGTQNLRVFA